MWGVTTAPLLAFICDGCLGWLILLALSPLGSCVPWMAGIFGRISDAEDVDFCEVLCAHVVKACSLGGNCAVLSRWRLAMNFVILRQGRGVSVCLQSASRAVQLEGLLFLPELSLFLKSLVRPRQTSQLGCKRSSSDLEKSGFCSNTPVCRLSAGHAPGLCASIGVVALLKDVLHLLGSGVSQRMYFRSWSQLTNGVMGQMRSARRGARRYFSLLHLSLTW